MPGSKTRAPCVSCQIRLHGPLLVWSKRLERFKAYGEAELKIGKERVMGVCER